MTLSVLFLFETRKPSLIMGKTSNKSPKRTSYKMPNQ